MNKHTIFPILTVVLFVILVGLAVFRFFYQVRVGSEQIISQEVSELVKIFERIDKTCKIIDFDYQKDPINFLNVEKFAGSEVGSMYLAYPQKWEGPYLKDNPTIQEKEYMIVHTRRGHFITPGDGVRLGNGKLIGKDIVLDYNANIPVLMQDENALMFQGKSLAAPLPVGTSAAKEVLLENIVRAEDGLVMREDNGRLNLGARW